jgi:hypothetical protein
MDMEDAMDDATRMATQRLYAEFWQQHQTPRAALGASLLLLAEALERNLSDPTLNTYLAALSGLSRQQAILAFARATEECRYFPAPATLLEYSGRGVTGDAIAREAAAELRGVLEAMRGPHGPTLKDIPGRVLYGTEDDPFDEAGNRTYAPIRAPGRPFPRSRRLQAALLALGWGDSTRGIALIAEHPAVAGKQDPNDPYRPNQMKVADEILRRFTEAWRNAEGEA